MGVWSLLNGTDTVAPPGEGERLRVAFQAGEHSGGMGTGRYTWAALWFPFLQGQLFPGWLQDVSPQSLFFFFFLSGLS